MHQINSNLIRYSLTRFPGILFTGLLILIVSGCAAPYHKISPAILEYTYVEPDHLISYGYNFNVFDYFNDKKYALKEKKNNIKLVAFEIKNLSGRGFDLVNDCEYVQNGDTILTPLRPDEVYSYLALSPKKFLPMLFLSSVNYYWVEKYGPVTDQRKQVRMIPVGFIFAPLLTIYNTETTKQSNIRMAEDLDKYTAYSRITPGEKKYILISFKDITEQPVYIRMKKK